MTSQRRTKQGLLSSKHLMWGLALYLNLFRIFSGRLGNVFLRPGHDCDYIRIDNGSDRSGSARS